MSKSKFEKLQEKALKLDFILTKVEKGEDFSGKYLFIRIGDSVPIASANNLNDAEVFIKTEEGIYK